MLQTSYFRYLFHFFTSKNHALRRKLLVFTLRFPESINIFYRSDLRDQFFVFRRQILAYKCDVTTSCTSVGIGDQTIHGCTGPTNQWERSVGMTHEALRPSGPIRCRKRLYSGEKWILTTMGAFVVNWPVCARAVTELNVHY